MYIPLEKYDQFLALSDFSRNEVTKELVEKARRFHESDDLEELLLNALIDPNRTPHGPVEIADILTLQLSYRNKVGVAGIVLKGRSFSTIRPSHISHQIFRLRKISDLNFALFGHTGNLLDEAREEFIHTAEDLGVDYTIIDATDFARLAVVSDVLCPRDAKKLRNGRCSCGYRAKGDLVNFLQIDVLKRLKDAHLLQQESGVVVMPTGSGKTRIAAIDSARLGARRILYVAHTHEILRGAAAEFAHVFGNRAIHMDWQVNPSDKNTSVHLCTIQKISRNLGGLSPNQFDYVVVDEFHHAAAKSYRKLISNVSPKFLLGLTATPFRGDRQDVLELCNGNLIASFELRTGIDGKILVPFHYYGCFDNVDYTRLRNNPNGYSIRDLNKALIIPERDQGIIEKWKELSDNLPTIAFCCSMQHAIRTTESLNKAGIPAAYYLATTPQDNRQELINRLQFGDLKILCCVDVLNEGVDIPFVECLLFLRPTESKRIFFQQLGRGLRKSPGKQRVLVLDFIGNFHNSYRIVDYIGLLPEEYASVLRLSGARTTKQLFNLPLGCKVEFDDRVVEVFANQILDPRRANRNNIAQILIFQYRKTSRWLGRPARKEDVNRYQFLNADLYGLVFGNWSSFEVMMKTDDEIRNLD